MSRGQMLRGQMSPWQLESVLNVHRNLPLRFHQNRISNSWDIADIEFLWWVVVVVGCGRVCKAIFVSNPTYVELSLSWVGALTMHEDVVSMRILWKPGSWLPCKLPSCAELWTRTTKVEYFRIRSCYHKDSCQECQTLPLWKNNK